jgi:hypothetical protein
MVICDARYSITVNQVMFFKVAELEIHQIGEHISSFFIFLLIDSIKYGWIPKTAKEHASVLQGPFVCHHIV